jgi:predicted small lipoprotein YifL
MARKRRKKLALTFGILPLSVHPPVVVATRLGRHPNFVQRFLQIDNDLAAIGKSECDHAPGALVVHIGVSFIVDAITTSLHPFKQSFCVVHKFGVSHYNFTMLYSKQILVSTLALVASVLNVAGCGQTGALYLPPPSNPTASTKTNAAVTSSTSTPASNAASAPSANTFTP